MSGTTGRFAALQTIQRFAARRLGDGAFEPERGRAQPQGATSSRWRPATRIHASLTYGDLGMDAYAFGPGAAQFVPTKD